MLKMTEEDFEKVIKINLTGAFNMTQVVLKQMIKAREGAIINMSSVVGLMGNIGQANYAASKAGLIGFTKSVAREVANRNVRVNALAPGMIESDMTAVCLIRSRKRHWPNPNETFRSSRTYRRCLQCSWLDRII